MKTLSELKDAGEAASWTTEEGLVTLRGGYLLAGETPKDMYWRVSNAAASRLNNMDLASKFFDLMWRGWLGLASPVASNMGADNLPISCFSSSVPDSTSEIFMHYHEIAMLSKYGGGTGSYWGNVRGRNAPISKGGTSEGTVPWLKTLEQTTQSVSQAGVRRGSVAAYQDIDHVDIEEFVEIRKNSGDISRKCLSNNFHHGVCITDKFMESLKEGNKKNRALWEKILVNRVESGEPYIMFKDTANRLAPKCYKDRGLKIETSNLCLSGNTLVTTKEYGPTPIKDLVGKEVTIYDGGGWVKNKGFKKTSESATLYRVHLSDGSTVDCTAQHRWFAKPANKRESEVKKYTECTALDLKEGMKLEYHCETYEGSVRAVGAYAKGFLLAEGTRMQVSALKEHYKPFLWIYENKKVVFTELKKSLEEIAPTQGLRSDAITEITLNESQEGRYAVGGLPSLRDLLPWCTDFKKTLPKDVFNWDFESKEKFIAGLFDGDGCYLKSSGGYQLASIHKQFLLDLQMLLKTMGVRSHVGLAREAGETDFNDGYGAYETQECHRITVSSYWADKLSDRVKFQRLSQYDRKKPNRYCADFNRVVKVEKLQEPQETYCTTVPTTGKFGLSNGITTGNCSEIFLHTDADHTFVCCLSSMNLALFDEWKDTDAVFLATIFLDGVMQEFIDKARHIPGFEKSVRFAEKSRALGLGVIGWHTLLQSKMIPFDSFDSMMLNAKIFSLLDKESLRATQHMAKEYGEPEWCVGYGVRNTHRLAIAPTTTNAILAGGVSQGIEPVAANIYNQKTSKGVFIRKNPILAKLLQTKGFNTIEVWNQINQDRGSVKNVACLTPEEKEVFLTAREINQFAIVRQAGQRQKFIDQGSSVNLFFAMPSDVTDEVQKAKLAQYIHDVHMEAWELGLKSLYYLRTESILKGEPIFQDSSDCKSCEG